MFQKIIFWFEKIVPNFRYQKMIFWNQKLIDDNRKSIFWYQKKKLIPENGRDFFYLKKWRIFIYEKIVKNQFGIRNSDFIIENIFWYQKIEYLIL